MRIGMIGHLLSFESSYRQAGISRYIEGLVQQLPLVAPDDDLLVFRGRGGQPPVGVFPPSIEWKTSLLPTVRPEARILWEQTLGMIVGRRYRLDVLHAPVNVAPLLTGVPRVVTIHDLAFEHYPEQYPGAKQRYLRTMARLTVKRANHVIADSEATRQDVIAIYNAPPERVTTVPLGAAEHFRPLPEPDVTAYRERRQLPAHFILYVGTLQPRKNLETLLLAYARLPESDAWPLVVAGAEGWSYRPIFETAERLGLLERVRFVGFVPGEDLPLLYNAASVFVYPSLYEGFGLPLLEAMACGTTVIGSTSSSLPEVVGEAGLLVDPRDAEGLTAALAQLLGDAELRAKYAELGLAQAATFSWRRTAEETLAVYRSVTG